MSYKYSVEIRSTAMLSTIAGGFFLMITLLNNAAVKEGADFVVCAIILSVLLVLSLLSASLLN